MRLAFIAPFALHPKGTTRWRVLPLAQALAACGHQVHVVIAPYDWPSHGGKQWQASGVEIVTLPVNSRLAAWDYLALGRALAQSVSAWQPDIIHCFKPKGPGGVAAGLLLSAQRPVVLDTDDYEAGWNEAAGYPRLWQAFFRWQERLLLRQANAVTAASQWLYNFAQGLGQRHCYYLPNGVEISCSQNATQTQQSASLKQNSRLRALLYSRFVEHSPQDVWAVWQRVLARESQAQLIVVGEGAGSPTAHLSALAATVGAGDSIRAVGWCPAPTRAGVFAGVQAAFLPVQDTLLNRAKSPMRLLDLLAAGVPVATQQVGEYALYARHGASGLVSAADDPAALAENVLRLLQDRVLAARLAHAAQQQMAAEQGWLELAKRALVAYAQALVSSG